MPTRRDLVRALEEAAGAKNVLWRPEDLAVYEFDGTIERSTPHAVVLPGTAEEVAKVVRACNRFGVPITPRGAGTGLSGGSVPAKRGVVIGTGRMRQIIEIDKQNRLAVVEPGVPNLELSKAAAPFGLFYAPDPSSQQACTIGGNVAENAGGLRAGKYGVTRNYLLQLEGITPTGEAFQSGARTRKCVAGYDLVSLMCGSEGTLGVITEVSLALVPLPKYRKSMMATFPDAPTAGRAVANVIAAGLVPATLEIIDNFTLRTIEDYAHLGLPVDAGALLLAEFDGLVECAVAEEGETCKRVFGDSGASDVQFAKDDAERDRIWQARRVALAALSRAKPTTTLEDVTVPLPKLAEMIQRAEQIGRDNRLPIGTFGHAGDGNLHPTILSDERDAEEMERVEIAVRQLIDAALSLGGTISGEHGVGFCKAPFLADEVGEGSVEMMRRIKRALDPNSILNPGKFV